MWSSVMSKPRISSRLPANALGKDGSQTTIDLDLRRSGKRASNGPRGRAAAGLCGIYRRRTVARELRFEAVIYAPKPFGMPPSSHHLQRPLLRVSAGDRGGLTRPLRLARFNLDALAICLGQQVPLKYLHDCSRRFLGLHNGLVLKQSHQYVKHKLGSAH
jgi:hypothetical protein